MANLRYTKIIIKTLALVFFIWQLVSAVQHYLAKPTMTSSGSRSLSSLEKPLLISVCKTSQFNYTRGIEFGYKLSSSFLAGQTNGNVLSWTGQHGNLTWNETFNFLFDHNIENIELDVENMDLIDNGSITNRILIPNGLCKVYEGKPLKTFIIRLNDRGSSEYAVYVSDPAAANSFQLPYSLLTGDSMRIILASNSTKFVDFNIKLTETIFEANDGSCYDYPTQTHQNYADCVDSELREQILPVLGCMVPWMSKLDYCTNRVQILPEYNNILQMLYTLNRRAWGGVQYKPAACSVPCTLLSAHATFQQSGIGASNNAIVLDFDEDIKVETILLAYDCAALLVEIGSSLGLWLGKSYKI